MPRTVAFIDEYVKFLSNDLAFQHNLDYSPTTEKSCLKRAYECTIGGQFSWQL